MPAPPEVAKPGRAVGAAEVLRKDEPEQQREADRDVRVAGEVAVDLRRIGERREDRVGREVRLGHPEDRVDDLAGEHVGDQDLLHQSEPDQHQPGADRDAVRVAGRPQLGQELARAHDRAGDEVGEEAEVDRGVEQRRRLGVAALDVDDVGDRLEGEEADPDRQRDRQQRERHAEGDRVEHVAHVGDEEGVVLEHAQHEQVPGHGQAADPLPPSFVVRPADQDGGDLVADRDAAEQQAEAGIRGGVEDVARDDDERLPQRLSRHQQPREAEDDREEDRELDRREEHRAETPSGGGADRFPPLENERRC